MFSNTAYEALYQILGLELHAKFIELITGEAFFKTLILMIFGAGFLMTAIQFVSHYIPGSLVQRHHIPFSKFVKLIACLFIGLAILRVGATSQVTDYKGQNWSENSYVQDHFKNVQSQYRVSVVFQLISHTAEEITALLTRVIDDLFEKGNSQLTAPNMFYKAIMYAGTSTIDDPKLRDQIQFYTDECFTKVIPGIDSFEKTGTADGFFRASQKMDEQLRSVTLDLGNGQTSDCYKVKQSTVSALNQFAATKTVQTPIPLSGYNYGGQIDESFVQNQTASMALANYYADQREGRLGIQKGAELPGNAGGFFQVLNRLHSFDGILGMLGLRDAQGASEAADRAQEFSEHLARAPHVSGFVRMALIAIFPFLMFFVVAGRWRYLLVWFWVYLSVLLWTPIWTLLYHVMLSIAMSGEVLQAFGNMTDGVSLYSAAVVNHRLYYMFSIYSWVQLLVATTTTGSVFLFLKPMLGEGRQESAPEFIGSAQKIGGAGVDVAQADGALGVAGALL